MTWWFTTFTAPEVKHKVRFLTGVEFLYDSVSPEQLDIPQFIMDCDNQVSLACLYIDLQVINTNYSSQFG